ncbi:MAG TPA: GAF domain-containing protein [Blastocatellia bacterium]|jgi:GAF domain-containing protein
MAEGKIQQAQDTSERLKQLYELALTVAGDTTEVFDRIVRIIAELFGVRVALVERLEGDKIITLSMYLDGKVTHDGVFDLAGTPCADVRDERSFCAFNSAIRNYPQDKFLSDFGLESYIGVPVVSTEGEVIAIINAMNDRPINLTEDDKLFFQALASRVRLELERAHQASEAASVRALLDISRELTRIRQIDETLIMVVDKAREMLGVDIAAFATIDDPTGTTSWKAMSGFLTDTYKHTLFAPGKGSAGRAIEARKTLVLEGIGRSAELPAEEFPILSAEGVINSIAVPLMAGERVVGVLIAGYRSDHIITEQEVKLAETIGSQAAVAIENARLFTELASANERLSEMDMLKTELIAELSTPVIPIWDGVLLAPIIGTITGERAEAITDALLQRASGGGADVVILDITGARTLDTDAAHHLRNTITAVQVLGARCILTGIRASVAQTLIQLGITLEDIVTRRRLSDALPLALEILARNQRDA